MNDVADRRFHDQVVEIYNELRAAEQRGTPPDFSAEQVGALRQMAEVWVGFQTMGKIATWLQKVLKYVAWAVGAFLLYQGWSAGWFRGH